MLGKRTRLHSIVPNPTTCFISDWTTHTLTLAEQLSTSHDSKMSHVVFYTVLGDGQHSLSPKTPANTCGFALNRSGGPNLCVLSRPAHFSTFSVLCLPPFSRSGRPKMDFFRCPARDSAGYTTAKYWRPWWTKRFWSARCIWTGVAG